MGLQLNVHRVWEWEGGVSELGEQNFSVQVVLQPSLAKQMTLVTDLQQVCLARVFDRDLSGFCASRAALAQGGTSHLPSFSPCYTAAQVGTVRLGCAALQRARGEMSAAGGSGRAGRRGMARRGVLLGARGRPWLFRGAISVRDEGY